MAPDLFPEQARAYSIIKAMFESQHFVDHLAGVYASLAIKAIAEAGMEVRTVPHHTTPTSEFHRP